MTEQRRNLIDAIMAEARRHLAAEARLQYAAHLLRENEDFYEENAVVPRGRPPKKGRRNG